MFASCSAAVKYRMICVCVDIIQTYINFAVIECASVFTAWLCTLQHILTLSLLLSNRYEEGVPIWQFHVYRLVITTQTDVCNIAIYVSVRQWNSRALMQADSITV